jgi:YaiO family outer membrane protein
MNRLFFVFPLVFFYCFNSFASTGHNKKNVEISAPVPLSYEKINNYFHQGQLANAKKSALLYLKQNPNDGDVRLVLGQVYLNEKNYGQAEAEFLWILSHYPNYVEARVFLADVEIAKGREHYALQIINQGLLNDSNNPYLLSKKAQIYLSRYQYAQAAALAKQVIAKNPNNSDATAEAQETLASVKEINPHEAYGLNEIGISSGNDYVSDLGSVWDYSSAYYARDTALGRITTSINYASRFGVNATQEDIAFSPVVNKYIYFDLEAACANQPILFPRYLLGGVAHFSIPHFVDIASGDAYSNIGSTHYNAYTSSLSKYAGLYWFSFQPYYFVPSNGATSILYTGTIRRYFGTYDFSFSVTAGAGRSPDLANLQNASFITIQNDFVAANLEFPIFEHRVLIDLGADYEHWVYPAPFNFVRNLTGGTVGLRYKF